MRSVSVDTVVDPEEPKRAQNERADRPVCDPSRSFMVQLKKRNSRELLALHPGGKRRRIARHGVTRRLAYAPSGWLAGAPGFQRTGSEQWLAAPGSYQWFTGTFSPGAERFVVSAGEGGRDIISSVRLYDVKTQKLLKTWSHAEAFSISPVDGAVYLLFLDEMLDREGKPSKACWSPDIQCRASKRSIGRWHDEKLEVIQRFDETSEYSFYHDEVVALDSERYFVSDVTEHTRRYYDQEGRPLVPHPDDLDPKGDLRGGSFTWTSQSGLSVSSDGKAAVMSESRNDRSGKGLLSTIVQVDLDANTRRQLSVNGLFPVKRAGYVVFSADPERVQLVPAKQESMPDGLEIHNWSVYAYHLASKRLCHLSDFNELDARNDTVFPM